MIAVNVADFGLEQKLKRIGGAVKEGKLKPTFRLIGEMALRDQQEMFMQRASSGWPKLGLIGVVLRRKSGPLYGPADVTAAATRLKPLYDRGLLFMSLRAKANDNVFEVGELHVTVGTRDSRAAAHHRGRSQAFNFDATKQKIAASNLSFTKRGQRPPQPRADGKRHQWKRLGLESPWNPWAFAVFNALKKIRSVTPRARAIVVKATAAQRGKYRELVERAVRRLLAA